MHYGSLQQDDCIIDFDDEVDIVEYPLATENAADIDTENAADIDTENAAGSSTVRRDEGIESRPHNETEHCEIVHHGASIDNMVIQPQLIARSRTAPIMISVCGNMELTISQMVVLFVCVIILEYFVLIVITQ